MPKLRRQSGVVRVLHHREQTLGASGDTNPQPDPQPNTASPPDIGPKHRVGPERPKYRFGTETFE